MKIPSESYESISEQYSKSLDWITSIGVKIGTGRTSHYKNVIEHWTKSYKTASIEEGNTIFPEFVGSAFEIYDFITIYNAFKDTPHHQLKLIVEKLQKAVNGPIYAANESPKSTTARNFLFEVVVAARAHRPSKHIQAILDAKSDTGIRVGGKKLWIECKRITSQNKLEHNIRTASNQLESIMKKQLGSGHRGIVALDVSKLFDSGNRIFTGKNDNELQKNTAIMMDKFIQKNSHTWQSVYKHKSSKIIGTIIRFTFMSRSEERSLLVYTSQWAINMRNGITEADKNIQLYLTSSLDENTP